MTFRSIGGLAGALACGIAVGCAAVDEQEPALAAAAQAEVVWAGGTQPSLKGAYWLRYDDNYAGVSLNDNRRVSWNLETPSFGGFNPQSVVDLYTRYGIRTLIRIGDSPSVLPSAADAAALASPTFSCAQIAGWMNLLDGEAAQSNAAIALSPDAIAAFIFSNEPNVPRALATTSWELGGTAYARAYSCYVQRWRAGAKGRYPLLIAGPGGCNNGAVPVGCTSFYNAMLPVLPAAVDGFTIHAYGTTGFTTGGDTSGFQDQVDRINQSRPGRPVYITEFAVGGDASPPTGWGDYFDQRLDEVRAFNQTHGAQIKALVYFVDWILGARTGSCQGLTDQPWYRSSLCENATRAAWLAAPSAPAAGNQADIVEGLSILPSFAMPGQVSLVQVLTRNHGTTTWSGAGAASPYRLGAALGNGFTFSAFTQCGGTSNGVLDARVYTCFSGSPPGRSYPYQFYARAPTSNPTSATLSVRMVQDGVQWFGYGARFPVKMGQSFCGRAVTQCILAHRPDILPFYAANRWDTSCVNRDAIADNWCAIDPAGCSALKTGACSTVNSACRCFQGFNVDNTAIDSNGTFCGMQVCGRDRKIYNCAATGWINTQAACT